MGLEDVCIALAEAMDEEFFCGPAPGMGIDYWIVKADEPVIVAQPDEPAEAGG